MKACIWDMIWLYDDMKQEKVDGKRPREMAIQIDI